jgi:drug/metabolite transporter (DMT)-like permease
MSRTLPAAAGSLRGECLSGERVGIPFVMASAIIWSFGGTIARFLTTDDSWTIVFLRSIWAAAFLILFLLWRDGRKIILLFKRHCQSNSVGSRQHRSPNLKLAHIPD